jgi:hypothetical protein
MFAGCDFRVNGSIVRLSMVGVFFNLVWLHAFTWLLARLVCILSVSQPVLARHARFIGSTRIFVAFGLPNPLVFA